MPTAHLNRYLVAGSLKQETILPYNRPPILNQLGGSLLYAASGIGLWDTGISLLSRIGVNFPAEWLARLSTLGWDISGIKQLSETLEHRSFTAYEDIETLSTSTPLELFSAAGLPFPKDFIGFLPHSENLDSRTTPTPSTLKASDVPADYLDATAAHLCPLDFLSHSLLPPVLRRGNLTTITIEPGSAYMHPIFFDSMKDLLGGITAFLPSETCALNLFRQRSTDLTEISEQLAGWGCGIIVIQRANRGCLVYDHQSHSRWIIPAYPSPVVDITGASDSFCGGFLAGYRQTYDPLEAALYATISRSFCVESSNPAYNLGVMPQLAQARLESLRGLVRKL